MISKIREGKTRNKLTTRCTGTVAMTMNKVLLLLWVRGDSKALWDDLHVPLKGWASSQ
jgi:hypothetical protein